ncbi:MAG: hypothetical protein HY898_07300 [Deltaproteobacteria bacterium]|nr:hypothetical protein [Deltaproteobacteria bacterium]
MSTRGMLVGAGSVAVLALLIGGCCNLSKPKKTEEEPTKPSTLSDDTNYGTTKGTHFHFNRVPIEVDIPPGWKETQNTRNWAVFKPTGGGAVMAFSPGTDCGAVEQRFYGALGELGLQNVVWSGGQKTIMVNGLSTVTAEGTAIEASQNSYVKYALTKVPGRGCLVSIVNIWKNRTGDYMAASEKMFASVSRQ